MFSRREDLPEDWVPAINVDDTQDGDSGEFDVLMESNIPEAVDEVDEFPEVVEERLVSLFYFFHVWWVCNFDIYVNL